jgi:hypothetical protein
MKKNNLTHWIVLGLAVLLVLAIGLFAPKPLDWNPTYGARDKNPYGSALLYNRLKDLFPGQAVITYRKNFYRLVQDSLSKTKDLSFNLLIINDRFTADSLEAASLLSLVQAGAHAFMAAEDFYGMLSDTFHFALEQDLDLQNHPIQQNFENPVLRTATGYTYKKNLLVNHFSRFDSSRSIILGRNSYQKVTYLKIPFGRGSFYLHANPIAFTNYHLLKEGNHAYIEKALSYLPSKPVLWIEYGSYKSAVDSGEIRSPLRFLLETASLRWALYLTMAALTAFMFFEAKRKQRIIPVIKPLENTSLEFAQTVGSLYFQYKDHKNIADKKILYFMEFARNRYSLKTNSLDEVFLETLATKSGVRPDTLRKLLDKIRFIQQREIIAEKDLLQLNQFMEAFYKESI